MNRGLCWTALAVMALAASGGALPAYGGSPLPPAAWLDSLDGPPETIPPGLPIRTGVALFGDGNDIPVGFFIDSAGVRLHAEVQLFAVLPGDSLLIEHDFYCSWSPGVRARDSVCLPPGDSTQFVTWEPYVGPRHHGGIGISRIIYVPCYVVDTFWGQTPEFELANYGPTADSGWAFVLFSDTGQDRVVHVDSMWFSLEQGEHQDVAFESFRFHTLGPHVGTCGWNTLGRDGDSVSWRFDVAYLQPPEIGIVAFLAMPWDTIDTFTTWQPCVEVKNTGVLSDSVWVALRFSDTLGDRTVYADSHHLLLYGGQSVDVSFRSIRFNVPGPYHGQLALRGLHGEGETLDWDFWVDSNLGVEERSACAGYDDVTTVVRGVLFLGDCPQMGTVPKAVLLDISGRKVLDLNPGPNDVSRVPPGVYFVRKQSAVGGERSTVHKVVITK